ncbi:MAG: TonB-dependent receptor [Ginsengibacter sp.]
MSRYFIIIGFVIFLFANASSQMRSVKLDLTGKITAAKTGLPLQGASVYISDLKKGTSTDSTGAYYLTNIPSGNYVIEIGFVGFKTQIRTINVSQSRVQNFVLDVSITEENEIVVTGTSKATSLRKNPIPIVSISKQYMQQNLSTNIIDAISRVPGINAVTTGPNVSKPFIRGLGFNRILTLYDGVRQEGQQWGDEHGIEVDQNDVDKVEVVKGPASLIYGSDAVAGVVNLLPPNPPPSGHIIGNFSNEYQTNNRLISNSASISGNTNSVIWLGRFSHKIATNYTNRFDGKVYHTGFEETDFTGMVGLNRAWGYTHAGISLFNNLQEIPDGSRDSASRKFTKQITEEDTFRPIVTNEELVSYKITDIHQHVQHYRIYSASNFILGKDRLAVNFAFQRSIRQEFSHPTAQIPGLYLQLNTFSYDFKYNLADKSGWGITAGINGMYQTNNADKGTEFVIPSYHQFDVGPFIFVKKTAGDLEFAGGLRYDSRFFSNKALYTKPVGSNGFDQAVTGADTVGAENRFKAYTKTFSGVSGSLGLSYKLSNELSIKANVGRGFRAPNISEISANGVHPGTNIYQVGNSSFKPEFNLQEDIGLNYNTKHFTLNAELFNNNITNYIFNQKLRDHNGADSVIIAGNQTFQFQQSAAQLYGGEFTIDIHPHPLDWLHFENSLSIVYAKNRGKGGQKIMDSAKFLPFIPPLHTYSELRGSFKHINNTIANAFIKFQMEYYASQNRVYLENNTETPTSGYTLFNSGFGFDILNARKKTVLTFSFLANNLFDRAYQSHLNRLKYFEPYPNNFTGHDGIYNMGRNFAIKVNIPFDYIANKK